MNKKTTILVIVLLVVVAGAGAWVYAATKSSNTKNNTNQTNTTNNNQDTTDHSNMEVGATITATNDGFTPSTVTIKKGQMIKIVNNSSSSIQFSSADHPTHLLDPELNMSELAAGASGEVMPEKVGTHGYHDHLHPDHTGTIVVTE